MTNLLSWSYFFRKYNVSLFLSGFFYSAQYFWGLSILEHVSSLHSSLWVNMNILHSVYHLVIMDRTHSVYFQLWTINNRGTMSIHVQMFTLKHYFSSFGNIHTTYLKAELMNYMVIHHFRFWPLPYQHFTFGWCEVAPQCGFICISLMANKVEHWFLCLLAICKYLPCFFMGFVCLLLSLSILQNIHHAINVSDIWFESVYAHFQIVFSLLCIFLNLRNSNLSDSLFVCVFAVLRIHFQIQSNEELLLCLLKLRYDL